MYHSLLDEPFSLNVGAMDFSTVSLSHIKNILGYRYTLNLFMSRTKVPLKMSGSLNIKAHFELKFSFLAASVLGNNIMKYQKSTECQ